MSGCLHDFIRLAYYGGRTEVYREKFDSSEYISYGYNSEFLSYGDFNSMYAWAMLGEVPFELAFVHKGLVRIDGPYLGFIECTVDIPSDCYLPPLPHKQDGKLIFPTGKFSGVWSSAELKCLKRIGGHISDMRRSVWFRGKKVFKEYVEHWYAFRDKRSPRYSPAMAAIAKMFLVSLYGKFGQNPEREKLWFSPTEKDLIEHPMFPIEGPVGAFVEYTNSDPVYVVPHIAAWVTALARVRLWSTMMDYLESGDWLYYCDTDSIITDGKVGDSKELGELKLECLIRRGKFIAPKMYFLDRVDKDPVVKAKGFTTGFGSIPMTEKEFDSIVARHSKAKINRMRKLREGLRSGERFPAMHISEKGVKKKGELDTKRIHLGNGNTKAIVLNE